MITDSRLCKVSNYKLFLQNQRKSSFLTVYLFQTTILSMYVQKQAKKNHGVGEGDIYMDLNKKKYGLVIQRKQICMTYTYLFFNCLTACVIFKCINCHTFSVLTDCSVSMSIFCYSTFGFMLTLYFCAIIKCGSLGEKAWLPPLLKQINWN